MRQPVEGLSTDQACGRSSLNGSDLSLHSADIQPTLPTCQDPEDPEMNKA